MTRPSPRGTTAGTGKPSPPLGRRERKKREARHRIFQAAFDLFREKGFDATTVDEIAERADVAKGTVFNYFPRKASFLETWIHHWSDSLAEELGPVSQWEGTTRQKTERLFRFLANLAVQDPDLARQALFESLRRLPDADLEHKRGTREIQATIRTVLNDGVTAGDVRGDLKTEHAATLMESAFHRALIVWLRRGGSTTSLHREISSKLDIIFDGLATHPGAKQLHTRIAGRTRPRGRKQ